MRVTNSDRMGRTTGSPVVLPHSRFARALEAGDAAAASSAYAEGATLVAPAAGLLRGRTEIEAFWGAGISAGISEAAFEPLAFESRGELAYEVGRYRLRLEDEDGVAFDHGSYMAVHERQPDGSWQCGAQMLSADEAASPARELNSTADRKGET